VHGCNVSGHAFWDKGYAQGSWQPAINVGSGSRNTNLQVAPPARRPGHGEQQPGYMDNRLATWRRPLKMNPRYSDITSYIDWSSGRAGQPGTDDPHMNWGMEHSDLLHNQSPDLTKIDFLARIH